MEYRVIHNKWSRWYVFVINSSQNNIDSRWNMIYRKIIVYSWGTINAYSLFSHEWWVQLIKFMVGPTIHVRGVEHAFIVLREYLIIFHYQCGSDWDIKLDICKIKRLSYPWFDFLGKSISSKTIRLVLEIM